MRVVEIREEAAFQALLPAWTELLRQSASNTIFLTPEWVAAWWAAYGTPGELRVLAVYDDGGELRGIAPLRSTAVHRYGQTIDAFQFIGYASSYCDSDYLDFVVAPGYEQPVLAAFLSHVAEPLGHGSILLLNEIPETSPNLATLHELARGMVTVETDVPCATVRLPENWDDYLGMLKPRFRTKVRSVLRNLESRAEVRFRFCKTNQDIDRLLPVLFDLHARRWQQEGKPGVFGNPRKRNFYHAISRVLLDRGWLRFSWLEWNGRILACQYGFAYEGVYSQLQEGYEPASEHWNAGVGLRAWSIREFLKQGLREYDFLGGVSRHKTDWGSEVKQSKRILLARRTAKNALFIHGPELEAGIRQSIRAIVPEKILAARAARQHPSNTNGEWIRQAAANCYIHSGAPALIRQLRKRYQLSMEPNGGLPRLSWRKRVEAGARIFYYHRVNNENDPFSPAVSTEVFEAHMSYLARHYKVVGMDELSRHLESGDSTEAVVGITFDDGYLDNYECALPILKRYNLPATIFLTTGHIDSGELLWFEQLAEAVRGTSREYIDLEIDIPRRFWMRTERERLDANAGVFRLLRVMSDGDRRTWLVEVLDQLDAKSCARKSRMLSWDQVRSMKTSRIDFGGHTVTHPFLSKLTGERAAWEVAE
jgi:CelD/BcsL family acetyltransferase involved in cellulose biosynthesis/peptidoglycan/xylan/chitin deacetylase (PgdA/CDA1 family)